MSKDNATEHLNKCHDLLAKARASLPHKSQLTHNKDHAMLQGIEHLADAVAQLHYAVGALVPDED